MESVLQGIPREIVHLDDILVSAATEEEHLQRLEMVFDCLEKAGLRARESKCEFMVPSVYYLGHQIDEEGLHLLADKVHASCGRGTEPQVCTRIESLPGAIDILLQVLNRCVHSASATVPVAEARHTVALVNQRGEGIP